MTDFKYKPQVGREHYFDGYDTKARWMSYWYQIQEVLKIAPKNLLEVGVGNSTVTNYLRKHGITVVTADVDGNLDPDYVCSVTELKRVMGGRTFDTVLCAEVLEHLRFEDVGVALAQIASVCKKYLVLTLPQLSIHFAISIKIPLTRRLEGMVSVPFSNRRMPLTKEHFWEIGLRGFSLDKIKKKLSMNFDLLYSYLYSSVLTNGYSY
jgi:hypothetical protein